MNRLSAIVVLSDRIGLKNGGSFTGVIVINCVEVFVNAGDKPTA